jgi:hypothetical protein
MKVSLLGSIPDQLPKDSEEGGADWLRTRLLMGGPDLLQSASVNRVTETLGAKNAVF